MQHMRLEGFSDANHGAGRVWTLSRRGVAVNGKKAREINL